MILTLIDPFDNPFCKTHENKIKKYLFNINATKVIFMIINVENYEKEQW